MRPNRLIPFSNFSLHSLTSHDQIKPQKRKKKLLIQSKLKRQQRTHFRTHSVEYIIRNNKFNYFNCKLFIRLTNTNLIQTIRVKSIVRYCEIKFNFKREQPRSQYLGYYSRDGGCYKIWGVAAAIAAVITLFPPIGS